MIAVAVHKIIPEPQVGLLSFQITVTAFIRPLFGEFWEKILDPSANLIAIIQKLIQ